MRFCPDEQHKDLDNNVSKIPKRGQNSKCQRNKTIKQVEWCFIFTVASPKRGCFCTFGSRLSAFWWETSSCHWQLDFYRKVISHSCCRGQRVRDWWTELSLNTWSRFSEPRNSFFWWCSGATECCVTAKASAWATEHIWNSCNHCFDSLWLYWFFLFPRSLTSVLQSALSVPRPCHDPAFATSARSHHTAGWLRDSQRPAVNKHSFWFLC